MISDSSLTIQKLNLVKRSKIWIFRYTVSLAKKLVPKGTEIPHISCAGNSSAFMVYKELWRFHLESPLLFLCSHKLSSPSAYEPRKLILNLIRIKIFPLSSTESHTESLSNLGCAPTQFNSSNLPCMIFLYLCHKQISTFISQAVFRASDWFPALQGFYHCIWLSISPVAPYSPLNDSSSKISLCIFSNTIHTFLEIKN